MHLQPEIIKQQLRNIENLQKKLFNARNSILFNKSLNYISIKFVSVSVYWILLTPSIQRKLSWVDN